MANIARLNSEKIFQSTFESYTIVFYWPSIELTMIPFLGVKMHPKFFACFYFCFCLYMKTLYIFFRFRRNGYLILDGMRRMDLMRKALYHTWGSARVNGVLNGLFLTQITMPKSSITLLLNGFSSKIISSLIVILFSI